MQRGAAWLPASLLGFLRLALLVARRAIRAARLVWSSVVRAVSADRAVRLDLDRSVLEHARTASPGLPYLGSYFMDCITFVKHGNYLNGL